MDNKLYHIKILDIDREADFYIIHIDLIGAVNKIVTMVRRSRHEGDYDLHLSILLAEELAAENSGLFTPNLIL